MVNILEIAQKIIASPLWAEWSVTPVATGHVTLDHADGRRIALTSEPRRRIRVSGIYPTCPRRPTPSITVSADRDPEDIAKDIYRRFLTPYTGRFLIESARARRLAQEEEQKSQLLADLANALGIESYEDDRSILHFYPDFPGHITVWIPGWSSPPRIHMELRSIPEDLARQILELIRNY